MKKTNTRKVNKALSIGDAASKSIVELRDLLNADKKTWQHVGVVAWVKGDLVGGLRVYNAGEPLPKKVNKKK